jgi:hypothetical protein
MHDLQDQIHSLFETGLLPAAADDIARRHRPVTTPFPARARRAVTARRVITVAASLAAAACTAAIVASQLSGAPAPRPARPALVDAAYVRHLAAVSQLALARSGQAVITSTGTEDKRWSTSTFRLTFSGANFDSALTYTAGGPGVRPLRLTQVGRVVAGQVYSYHHHAWYHETGQKAAADTQIPDPRPLLAELSPSARFVRVGGAVVDGIPVEHLQATALAGLPPISVWFIRQLPYGHIVSLDIWVDDHSVVRRLAWSVDAPTWFEYNATGSTGTGSQGKKAFGAGGKVIASGGHQKESTVVTFRDIGQPQVISVPPNAIPERSQG